MEARAFSPVFFIFFTQNHRASGDSVVKLFSADCETVLGGDYPIQGLRKLVELFCFLCFFFVIQFFVNYLSSRNLLISVCLPLWI